MACQVRDGAAGGAEPGPGSRLPHAVLYCTVLYTRPACLLGRNEDACPVNPTNFVLPCRLAANTIASSFGKVVGQHMPLEQYNPADVVQSLVRMISYNIGQLAYLNAKR